MSANLHQIRERVEDAGRVLPSLFMNDFDRESLRILRCAAHTMANSPGGLRFKVSGQPWLDEQSTGQQALIAKASGRGGVHLHRCLVIEYPAFCRSFIEEFSRFHRMF